jgi:hypothetical protein
MGMALFSKESRKNPRPNETVKRTTWCLLRRLETPRTVLYEDVAARKHASAPARHDVPAGYDRACLDSGSRISGKLFFEGPVRIDGQVDDEIRASDSVVIGEGAIVTAPLKARRSWSRARSAGIFRPASESRFVRLRRSMVNSPRLSW